ncbi:complex I subunit 5 family protein [Papillibacter cinnamivorans]|uniref:Multicomponent Na+:H+ antiporter subunit D n=1 Tax=Papillibacter cinnamivorans DSM 12816 TaxID=1122930 RepID=A0A1W2C478_9FIRM|nr:proton-conducting transporter membrane subunit [Papillibacter cinnamivorans]SMC79999.1 multicomponent Na+:H+ antiporter subunit D [Papillibacter cinnamivorans DSM 12816]
MMEHLPVLLVIVPLATALISPFLSLLSRRLSLTVIQCAFLLNFIQSLLALQRVLSQGDWHYWLGGWNPPYGIEFVLDGVSAPFAVVATGIAFLVSLYAQPFFRKDPTEREPRSLFYVLFLLMATGVTGVCVAGDVFTMYVFLEITSLSAYGLVALGGNRAVFAGFRYLILGTVGATFYLVGVGFLFAATGSLNIADLAALIPNLTNSPVVIFGLVLILVGMGVKSALVPLHFWLPDAHTQGPTPAIAYLATAMLKVFSYAMFRFLFTIFGGYTNELASRALEILGWLAAVSVIYGSVMAIAQTDFRRMLAYSTIAQVAYIPLAMAIGTPFAIAAALLQVLSHSMTKCLLFMLKGAMHVKMHTTMIGKLRGMGRIMPICTAALFIAAMSMIGLPPASGFFVKWQIVTEAAGTGKYVFIVVMILSGLLNAVYFFRVLENAMFLPPEGEAESHGSSCRDDAEEAAQVSPHVESSVVPGDPAPGFRGELPILMLAPIIILAVLIIVAGVGSGWILDNVLNHISLPGGGAYYG